MNHFVVKRITLTLQCMNWNLNTIKKTYNVFPNSYFEKSTKTVMFLNAA